MNLSFITKLLNKYLKVLRYGDRVHPMRDWLIIICIVCILFVASALWSYLIFRETSTNGVQASTGTTTPISTASLDTVRHVFETRAIERAHYLLDYRFVDPSK
ncbi:MAG: hypothetical protein JWO84_362 [Parcubacteria group bacterium]|nr:hypothetical protein [Parcubacteria group bacterium]